MVYEITSGGLTLSTRFLDEPALWGWEIHETSTRRLVESSWSTEWMAYGSEDSALLAGAARLTTLIARARSQVA